LAVAPPLLEAHCRWLRQARDVIPTLDYARAHVEGRLARRTVALTFDDGFADFAEHAMPLLRSYDLPVTMFLVARTLDEGHSGATWLRPQPNVAPATLSRRDVLELSDLGVEFGSHSWAHHDLRQLSESECLKDLRESRELLEDVLGRPVPLLAYPYGAHAPHVRRAAEAAGYRFSFTLPEGPEPLGPHTFPRVGLYRGNSVTALRVKSSSWYLGARMSSRPWEQPPTLKR